MATVKRTRIPGRACGQWSRNRITRFIGGL
jgi:hypothetical protein